MNFPPSKPPHDDANNVSKETALILHDSPDSLPVRECLEDANKDKSLVASRKRPQDACTSSVNQSAEEIQYQRRESGLGFRHVINALHARGKKFDSDCAERLVDLLELYKARAYADVMETLLNRLNFWLHGDLELWQTLDEKEISFGPFLVGRTGCAYSSLCTFWCGTGNDCLEWQETILDTAMQAAEDKYLAELGREGFHMHAADFRKEVYTYVTQMDRNLVDHEFGDALKSYLAFPACRVRLLENVPRRQLNTTRRLELMAKLKSMDSPPKGFENAFALQKQFLTSSLTKTSTDRGQDLPPMSSRGNQKRPRTSLRR